MGIDINQFGERTEAHRKKRPVDLGLLHQRQPLGALLSIAHRVTGVLLVAGLPFALRALEQALSGPAGFARVSARLATPTGYALVVAACAVFALHFFAGVRHLLLDLDIGLALPRARGLATAAFVAAVLATVLLAWRLW